MLKETPPLEFYKAHLRFLTAQEGGRHSPILFSPGKYRPIATFGDGNFHGAMFMTITSTIQPGVEIDVELVLIYQKTLPFVAGDPIQIYEGDILVATGEVLEKGVKQFALGD